MTKGDILYYARIIPNVGIYEILELKIRTVEETYFVGTEKFTKQAFLFGYSALERTVFVNREDALDLVVGAEEHRKKVSNEIYYEED